MLGLAVCPPYTTFGRRSRGRSPRGPRPPRPRRRRARGASALGNAPFGRAIAGGAAAGAAGAVRAVLAGERRGARLADVLGLLVEVLDRDLRERPEPEGVGQHLVRPLVVDVDLDRAGVAGHEHRLADRLVVVADAVDVERLARPRPWPGTSSRSRSPRRACPRRAAAPCVGRARARAGRDGRGGSPGSRGAATVDVAGQERVRALEQPEQALPARVDDARLAQDRQQRRRLRDRLLRRIDRGAHDRVEASAPLSALTTAAADASRMTVRIVPSTGFATAPYAAFVPWSRAFARSSALNRVLAGEALGEAAQDLARDHAGVAARAHERPERRRRRRRAPRRPSGRAPPPRPAPRGRWPSCSSRCRRPGPGRR